MPFDGKVSDYFETKPAPVYDRDNPPPTMAEAIRMAVADVEAQERAGVQYDWGDCSVCTAGAVCTTRLHGDGQYWGNDYGPAWQAILNALSALTKPGTLDNNGQWPAIGGTKTAYAYWPKGFLAAPEANIQIAGYTANPSAFKRDMLALADRLEADSLMPSETPDTNELKRLMEAATKGEWSVTDEREILSVENRNDPIDGEPYEERTLIAQGECSQNWGYIEWFNLADAALIVAAVNAMPELIAENERLKAEVRFTADLALEVLDTETETSDFWRGFPLVQMAVRFRSNGMGEPCAEGSYYAVRLQSKHGNFIDVLQTLEQLELFAAEVPARAALSGGKP